MAVSRGLNQFGRRMRVVADGFAKNAGKTIRKAAIAADQVVVTSTPVDTARARTNWFVSIGNIDPQDLSPPILGDGEAASAQALIQGAGVIATWKIGDGPIFIHNSVPYIVKLDEGHSGQAPDGMSKAAVSAARNILKNARLLRGA